MMSDLTAVPGAYSVGSRRETDAHSGGVSWSAVMGGASVSAAISLILVILGIGLGFPAVLPWSGRVAVAGITSLVWLTFSQLAASGLGGYVAGRLRAKWTDIHADEAHFRDTAHGLLSWSIASLVTASVLSAVVGHAIAPPKMAAAVSPMSGLEGNEVRAPILSNPSLYYSDMLLRSDQDATETVGPNLNYEVARILNTDVGAGRLLPEDRDYLARLVSKRSGLSDSDALTRVDDVYARADKAASDARETAKGDADHSQKAAAYSALWMFVALLGGAFVASLAATIGGRQRDHLRVYALRG